MSGADGRLNGASASSSSGPPPAGGGAEEERGANEEQVEVEEADAEKIEELLIWHRNVPVLYDLFIGCELEWPALSTTWLPDSPGEACRLAVGLHTDDSVPHEVIIAELCFNAEDSLLVHGDPFRRWSVPGLGAMESFGCEIRDEGGANGDSSGSAEGSAAPAGGRGPLREVARFAHPTEVNRILACPDRGQVLATKAANGAVLLFDYKAERARGVVSPDAELRPKGGEAADGFALDWGAPPGGKRLIASGGHDGRLCVWEVESAPKVLAPTAPILEVPGAHASAVCGASFAPASSPSASSTLATVGDDGFLRLWDVRSGSKPTAQVRVSKDEVLSVAWSPQQDNFVATCGKDKLVHVWDFRSSREPLHSLCGHEGDVLVVHWAPFKTGLLASCSSDRRLNLWDLAAEEPGDEEGLVEGEAKELLFSHGGHCGGVSDFSWSGTDKYLLCSVSEDNGLHIWQPSTDVYLPEDAGDAEEQDGSPSSKRARLGGSE